MFEGESYLSLEMLQSITVFLLVLTIMKGNWIAELGLGGPCRDSFRRFRSTKFLNEMCWRISWCNSCVLALILSIFLFRSFFKARHSCCEFVGNPNHLISFFSFEMIFIAIKTFKASYTRLLIFFWSYCCNKIKQLNLQFRCNQILHFIFWNFTFRPVPDLSKNLHEQD